MASVSQVDGHFSMKLTRFYLKMVGFWYPKNNREKWLFHAFKLCTVAAVIFGLLVLAGDLYHVWGDFDDVTYNCCTTLPLIVIAFKITICTLRRDAIIDLITYSEEQFWNISYDEFGENILKECERKGVVLLFILSISVQGTVVSYVMIPIFGNIGRNETDRILPFRLWVDLPLTVTPYYEITFTIQTLSASYSAICFFCFDNLLGILNIHAVGQFQILQHKLENLCEEYANTVEKVETHNAPVESEKEERLSEIIEKTHDELRVCVKMHLLLIDFIDRIEYVFNLVLLAQMILSSLIMGFVGFQVFLAKKGEFSLHLIAAFTPMLLFTWTSNEIILHSEKIGDAIYHSKWYLLPHAGAGYSVRQGLSLVMMRARRACYLSAGKFTPISLQTFNGVCSTTLSYLSLMRQMSDDLE